MTLASTGAPGLSGCRTDYTDLPTYSAERKLVQVVVEMPAGTNQEVRYNTSAQEFQPVQQAGVGQTIEFLPVPGNLGFVPGTQVSDSPASVAKPVPALVLAETQPAGTVLEVVPLALLLLDSNGSLEPVVVAIPARPAQRILPDATDWATLNRRYPGVRQSLSLWFQHRGRPGATRIAGWKDEKAAEQYIRRWLR
ncbi:inorganic pyrophosphatase [Hymenobacter luteus]|uniref:inorganic diphosphatase n=2 Tax=Hymenobacter TaxID=89966 RepID=A0A7W9SX03_9BACT|nr:MULTISPECIES: inorganic diphosphatase [Hymenobacter]MBB4600254.1 inorganic pyrophosphatase [Hymenobacter latericoloratus]MBB6057436.1 inorganic pyrophosphatase [Hymenobacter luteus]